MNRSDYSQGIVIESPAFASIDFRLSSESRILRAFGIGREEVDSAMDSTLFRSLESGSAAIVKSQSLCYVFVKLNGHNAGGGENSVVIGGKFKIEGGAWRDFAAEGSVVVGIPLDMAVYPIPGKIFGPRERRALRHA